MGAADKRTREEWQGRGRRTYEEGFRGEGSLWELNRDPGGELGRDSRASLFAARRRAER